MALSISLYIYNCQERWLRKTKIVQVDVILVVLIFHLLTLWRFFFFNTKTLLFWGKKDALITKKVIALFYRRNCSLPFIRSHLWVNKAPLSIWQLRYNIFSFFFYRNIFCIVECLFGHGLCPMEIFTGHVSIIQHVQWKLPLDTSRTLFISL